MAVNIEDPEAKAWARQFASIAGLSLPEAVTVAMTEAIARRCNVELPRQTAARLREKHGTDERRGEDAACTRGV